MKNRRDFLKSACKPVVLATLGIPLIEACSTDEETEMNSNSVDNDQTAQNNNSSKLEINLDDDRFKRPEASKWLVKLYI